MGLNIVEKIDDVVEIKDVLISVSDKRGLESFIEGLIEIKPDIHFFSTGGTFSRIEEILGQDRAIEYLSAVSDYTGQPEMQGGLVKTLDFKIYLGLLSETYNPAHKEDLERVGAKTIDMVVVNLYPFKETISRKGVSLEEARANIDIGGPCMIRAAAKNFIRVASVVNPDDYEAVIKEMKENQGKISLEFRFILAGSAFEYTAGYDRAIADYLSSTNLESGKWEVGDGWLMVNG